MSKLPAPESLTQKLSRRAVEIAQATGPRKTGKALQSITPAWQKGIVGINVPPEAAYLSEINDGYPAKILSNLANRNIPFRKADGTLAFRTANPNKIGTIPIITRAAANGQILSGGPHWVISAQPGTRFLEKSIYRSVDEWERSVTPEQMLDILMQSDLQEGLERLMRG